MDYMCFWCCGAFFLLSGCDCSGSGEAKYCLVAPQCVCVPVCACEHTGRLSSQAFPPAAQKFSFCSKTSQATGYKPLLHQKGQ